MHAFVCGYARADGAYDPVNGHFHTLYHARHSEGDQDARRPCRRARQEPGGGKRAEQVATSVAKSAGFVTYSSDSLSVRVNEKTGGISFLTPGGEELLLDKDYGTSFAFDTAVNNDSTYKVRSSFLLDSYEPVYGIGQVIDGKFDRRNTTYHLQNENMFTYSPYFISPTKGYAVYWDNYSISDFVDTPQDLSYTALGDKLDYYFIYGKTPAGTVSNLRTLTGKAPMLPLWAYGFFQSWCQYNNSDELLGALKKFRDLKVPVDCMVLDWRYWPEYNHTDSAWNSHSFDRLRFPDPKAMTDEIHDLNGKLMIVAWPGFGPKTAQYQELDSKGYIFPFDTWPPRAARIPTTFTATRPATYTGNTSTRAFSAQ